MNIRPLGKQVLVTLAEEEQLSVGGIILTDVSKRATNKADVMAIGDGTRLSDGSYIPLEVQVGHTVVFKGSGVPFKHQDINYIMLNEDDILAIL